MARTIKKGSMILDMVAESRYPCLISKANPVLVVLVMAALVAAIKPTPVISERSLRRLQGAEL